MLLGIIEIDDICLFAIRVTLKSNYTADIFTDLTDIWLSDSESKVPCTIDELIISTVHETIDIDDIMQSEDKIDL